MILYNGHSVKIKHAPKSKHNDKANFPFRRKVDKSIVSKMHYALWSLFGKSHARYPHFSDTDSITIIILIPDVVNS